MDLVGLIASVRVLLNYFNLNHFSIIFIHFFSCKQEKYDYNEKLFESDQSVSNSLVKELEDFNTGICFSKSVLVTRWANFSVKIKGLKYRLDEKSGNCTTSKIDRYCRLLSFVWIGLNFVFFWFSPSTCSVFEPNGKVRIRNPKEFFNFDSDNYHFTGQVWRKNNSLLLKKKFHFFLEIKESSKRSKYRCLDRKKKINTRLLRQLRMVFPEQELDWCWLYEWPKCSSAHLCGSEFI